MKRYRMVDGLIWFWATALLPMAALGGQTAPPADGGGPVEVDIGFHVVDFAKVTAREENFDVTAHLELRWRDPRLKPGPVDGKIWTPRLGFDNAVDYPKTHGEPVIEVGEDGWVSSRSIMTGKFSTPLDLRRFPFDWQTLNVRISLFDDETKARLKPLAESMHMHDDAFVTDWSNLSQGFHVDPHRYRSGGPKFSVLNYWVRIERRSTFYVWRVLLPLTILALIPTLVFWFEPSNLQPQISTCMGTWIAMLTFGYSVDFALPKVAYLTFVDRHAMIGFLFATAAAVSVTLIHRSVANGDLPGALRIQKKMRWRYPVAYVALAILSAADAFSS